VSDDRDDDDDEVAFKSVVVICSDVGSISVTATFVHDLDKVATSKEL